jgi:hypothetical protein
MKDDDTFRLLDAVGAIVAALVAIVVGGVGALSWIVWGPR